MDGIHDLVGWLERIGVTPAKGGDIAFVACIDATCYFSARYGGMTAAVVAVGVVFVLCVLLHTYHRPWVGQELEPIIPVDEPEKHRGPPPDVDWR